VLQSGRRLGGRSISLFLTLSRSRQEFRDCAAEVLELKRLIQDRVNRIRGITKFLRVCGYHQNRLVGRHLLDSGGKFVAIHVGHLKVCDDQIKMPTHEQVEGHSTIPGLADLMAIETEQEVDGFSNGSLIVNQQDTPLAGSAPVGASRRLRRRAN